MALQDNCYYHLISHYVRRAYLKYQALLDEKAVGAGMAYVYLSPVRANMVNMVKIAQYTAMFKRIHN